MIATNRCEVPRPIIKLASGGDLSRAKLAIKSSGIPVLAAPHSQVMGGGCETCLHADSINAHAETYSISHFREFTSTFITVDPHFLRRHVATLKSVYGYVWVNLKFALAGKLVDVFPRGLVMKWE